MELINATIGWAIPCLATDQATECCSLDCITEVPMYIGLAVAIAGFAISIITGLGLLWTLAFGALGIVCVLGLYHARKSRVIEQLRMQINELNLTLEKMEKIRSGLEATNTELKTSVAKLENTNEEIKQTNIQLHFNVSNLENRVTDLNNEIADLNEKNRELSDNIFSLARIKTDLENTAKSLNREKLQLMNQVRLLTGVAQRADGLLAQTQEHLKQLQEQRLEIVETIADNISNEIDKTITSLSGAVNIIVLDIKTQIQQAGKLYEEIYNRLTEDIRDSVRKIGDEYLQVANTYSVETLRMTRAELSKATEELSKVQKQIEQANRDYQTLIEENRKLTLRNEAATRNLEETRLGLADIQKQLKKHANIISDAVGRVISPQEPPHSMVQALSGKNPCIIEIP